MACPVGFMMYHRPRLASRPGGAFGCISLLQPLGCHCPRPGSPARELERRCKSLARRAVPCIRSQIPPRLARSGAVPTGGGSWDVGGRLPNAGLQGWPGQARRATGAVEIPQTLAVVPDIGLNLGPASVGPGGPKRELRRLFGSHARCQTTSTLTSGFDIQPTIARILGLKS